MQNLEKHLERLEAKRPSRAWVIARKFTHEDGTATFPTDRDRQLIESGEATFVIHHRVVGARPSTPPAR